MTQETGQDWFADCVAAAVVWGAAADAWVPQEVPVQPELHWQKYDSLLNCCWHWPFRQVTGQLWLVAVVVAGGELAAGVPVGGAVVEVAQAVPLKPALHLQ